MQPEYPQDALLKGAEGWVNVSMSVTPAGNVLDPRVEETSNGTQFNRAAIAAVRKWKYEPFVARDPQEKRRVTVRVDFRMEGSAGQARNNSLLLKSQRESSHGGFESDAHSGFFATLSFQGCRSA